MTPDSIPIIDFVPGGMNVVVGSGFSGTGFKLGPVTGELLADMVTGNRTKYDISHFRASRFKNTKPSSKI